MLAVDDLCFDYSDCPLLERVRFFVPAGSLLHLKCGNGSGKTTLLKLLAGILYPKSGCIRYDGQAVHDELALYQQRLCYVGHKFGVSQVLTVEEHYRFEENHSGQSLSELLLVLGLSGLENVVYGTLSMGQRRRLSLLRLLMSNASLWLLDEPLVSLDDIAVGMVMRLMTQQLENGGVIVITSHQPLPVSFQHQQEYQL